MQKRKIKCLILSSAFTLTSLVSSGVSVKAVTLTGISSNAPSVKSIYIDKTEAMVGDEITVVVEPTKKASELEKHADLCYITGTRGNEVESEVQLELVDGKYIGKIKVDEKFINGTWRPSFVVLKDVEKNVSVTYNSRVHKYLDHLTANVLDMVEGKFQIVGQTGDNIPPAFNKAYVDNKKVKLYDKVKLSIEASDFMSGLADKADACYILVNEKGYVEKHVSLERNGDKYEASLTVDESFIPGTWRINYLTIQDKDRNVEVVYNSQLHKNVGEDLSEADICIEQDIQGPKIVTVSRDTGVEDIDARNGHPFKQYKIAVEAQDESGLAEDGSVSFIMKANGSTFEKEVDLKLNEGKYEGTLKIYDYESIGTWKVNFVALNDKEDNVTVLYNSAVHNIAGKNFSAIDIVEDIQAPTFEDIEVKNLEIDGEYEISITPSKDVSGLAPEADLCYVSVLDNNREVHVTLELKEGKYVGIAKFDDQLTDLFSDELWKVNFVSLKDVSGNVNIVYNRDAHGFGTDMSKANIIIESDNSGPILKDVEVTSNVLNLYDKVGIAVVAEDGGAGLAENAEALYVSESGKELQLPLEYDEEVGAYVAAIQVHEQFLRESWRMSFVVLHDNEGNTSIYYNDNVHNVEGRDLSKADLISNNDVLGPALVKAEVIMNNYESSGEIEVIVEAKDDSGLHEEANICYISQDGREYQLPLKYDGNKYTANIKDMPIGNWAPSFIALQDKEANVSIVYNNKIHYGLGKDLSSCNILIEDDSMAPEFLGVEISKNELRELDVDKEVTLSIYAHDNKSGLGEAYAVYVSEDGRRKEIALEPTSNGYEAEIELDGTFLGTAWKLDFVVLKDKAENVRIVYNEEFHDTLSEDLSRADIRMYQDVIAPQFEGIVLNRDAVNENIIDIAIKANDESGLARKAALCYTAEINGKRLEKEVELELNDGIYEARINLAKEQFMTGDWEVSYIVIEDKNKNVSVVYNQEIHGIGRNLRAGNFTYEELSSNLGIRSITVSDNEINVEETVEIAIVPEYSKVPLKPEATVCYWAIDDNEIKEKEVTLKLEDGAYRGVIEAENADYLADWAISFVTFEGEDDNVIIVYNNNLHPIGDDLSEGNFNVIGDIKARLIENVNGFNHGLDAIIKAKITNYKATEQSIDFIFEVLDENQEIINKAVSTKNIKSRENTTIESRMYIPDEAQQVKIYIVDSEGNLIKNIENAEIE